MATEDKELIELPELLAVTDPAQLLFYGVDTTRADNDQDIGIPLTLLDSRFVQAADLGELAFIDDAPEDGSQYARQDGGWVIVTGGVASVFGRTGIVTAQAGDYGASLITNTPAGNIAAVTVQAALNELDTEKAAISSLAAVALSGDYGDLLNAPNLATVATTGAYSDLSGTPTLGTIASQNANNVTISGGSITGITDLAIADGGTGQSTAQAAINALSNVAAATNEHVLTKDTATGNALWKAAAGGVTSVFGRTGAVVAASGDYTAAQVTNAAAVNVENIFTANQGFGLAPTAQVEIQSDNTLKVALAVRAPAGGTVDIIQAYDNAGNLGFQFDRFAKFKILSGLEVSTAGNNVILDTSSSATSGNIQIQSRANAAVPLSVLPLNTSSTNNMTAILIRRRNSTTPGAGYGSHILFQARSSTTDDQDAARLSVTWATATHASRKARSVWSVYDTAEREGIRIEASGTAPMLGVLGASAIARQAHIADPSGGGTQDAEARTAINAILAALENFGFLATS